MFKKKLSSFTGFRLGFTHIYINAFKKFNTHLDTFCGGSEPNLILMMDVGHHEIGNMIRVSPLSVVQKIFCLLLFVFVLLYLT